MTKKQFDWEELKDACSGKWLCQPETGTGVTAISTDSRTIQPGDLYLALVGDRFDGHDFIPAALDNGAVALIVSKPVEANVPTLLVPDTLVAYQALAKLHRLRFPDLLMIGITGSSGKTSSKEILAAVAERRFGKDSVLVTQGNTNNHIGVPRNLLRLTADHACAILEMGTNAPGEIAALRDLVLPDVAVLTNVGPVHLEGLGSIDGVAREKSDVFVGTQMAILPKTFAENPIIAAKLPATIMVTGMGSGCDVVVDAIENGLTGCRFSVTMSGERITVDWGLTGDHMAMNAAAAFALSVRLNMPMAEVADSLKECRNETMRMQVIERNGFTFVNDAYNANPDSMNALIDWLSDVIENKERLVLVIGDMLELGENEIDLHRNVLDYAATKLKGARILGFGPRFSKAADDAFDSHVDMDDLKTVIDDLAPGTTIALKGSRGMGLERVLMRVEGRIEEI